VRGCGNAHPPADGTRDREVIDRFRDFLSEGWVPANVKSTPERPLRQLTAAERYRFHFQVWRIGAVPA
jgi:hypothetical protein